MISLDKRYFNILPEVADALQSGKPIVALESTVITHGLPFPENVKLASDLENEVRSLGCVPATIALIDGRISIGIDQNQLEQLVKSKDLRKVSVRDISPAIQKQNSGGTTVAGTLFIAQSAGIKVFATGGIGGVHRGTDFDVSTDLMQLSRSHLVTVCAGAKAILDIPATLEVLETYGIPVIGYQTDEFPAFYSLSSGIPVSARVDTPEEAASLAKTHWDLGFQSSMLVVVPPPKDIALQGETVESAIQKALEEVEERHIHGQGVTPYLLGRVSELTGGLSLQANLGLLKNNTRVASLIARAL